MYSVTICSVHVDFMLSAYAHACSVPPHCVRITEEIKGMQVNILYTCVQENHACGTYHMDPSGISDWEHEGACIYAV